MKKQEDECRSLKEFDWYAHFDPDEVVLCIGFLFPDLIQKLIQDRKEKMPPDEICLNRQQAHLVHFFLRRVKIHRQINGLEAEQTGGAA